MKFKTEEEIRSWYHENYNRLQREHSEKLRELSLWLDAMLTKLNEQADAYLRSIKK